MGLQPTKSARRLIEGALQRPAQLKEDVLVPASNSRLGGQPSCSTSFCGMR